MEGDLVLLGEVDADRVVRAELVQRQDVQEHHGEDHERQQVVQREEAVERRVVDREAAPQPGDDALADERDGREQVGDDGGAPEAHLAPGQHVAHEGRRHHQQQDDHAQHPQQLARRLVGAVVEAAEDVDVDHDEEHRGAVGVRVAQQPAVVHVAHDVLDASRTRSRRVRRVVHRQHDAGDDLQHQHDAGERAEVPEVVQVLRRRVGDELLVAPGDERQPVVDPAHHAALEDGVGNVGRHGCLRVMAALARAGWRGRGARRSALSRCGSLVSVRNAYSGTSGSAAPGPCGCGRRCRSASRGRGRTSRRSRPRLARLVAQRHAAEMGADADHDQPLGLLRPRGVGLRVAQLAQRHRVGLADLLRACGGGRRPACRATSP